MEDNFKKCENCPHPDCIWDEQTYPPRECLLYDPEIAKKVKARAAAYRKAHPEKVKAYMKAWRQKKADKNLNFNRELLDGE